MTRVKFEERKSKVVFVNEERSEFIKIKVDGCVVKNEVAADFVATMCGVGDIVVELKGKDVERAASQVTATLRLWRQKAWLCSGKIAGLIVSRQVPKATLLRKQREVFRQEFRCPLHVVSHNQEFVFENLLNSSTVRDGSK